MAQVDDFRSAPRHLSGSVSREARVPRKALPAAHGANVPQHRSGQNWQRFVAGGISGVAEVLVSHPLDLVLGDGSGVVAVKTVMQHERELGRRATPISIARDIFAREGVVGLYRGIVPRVLGVAPMRTVFWGSQSLCHNLLADSPMWEGAKLLIVGTVAGTAQTLIDNPIEVLKTRSMVESAGGHGPRGAAGVRSAGASVSSMSMYGGRFPGFSATLSRNVAFAVVFSYGLYFGASASSGSVQDTFVRGAAAGFVASLATQGFDYCKTVMQAPGGEHERFATIMARTPVRKLWVGAVPRAVLGMTTMSVGASVFSVVEKALLSR